MKITIFITLLAMMMSCTIEGDEGPQGPKGEAGQDANIHVEIFKFSNPMNGTGDWEYVDEDWMWVLDVDSIPQLTHEVMYSGGHHLYFESYPDVWMAIPYDYIGCSFTENRFSVWTNYRLNYDTTTFKLVVSHEGTYKNSDVNWNDWNDVANKFNLTK